MATASISPTQTRQHAPSLSTMIEAEDLPPAPQIPTAASEAATTTAVAATATASSSSSTPSPLYSSLLQKSYNPPFLSPSASILHCAGSLRKFGSKLTTSSLNARYFLLTHHSMQYYKSDPLAKPQGTIALIGAIMKEEKDDAAAGFKPSPTPNSVWSITTAPSAGVAPRKYILVSDTTAERKLWMEILGASTVEERRKALAARAASSWEEDQNLLVEGWMTKSGGELKQNWNRRYFIYRRSTHSLMYFKSALPRAAGFVPVEKEAIVDVVGKPSNANSELAQYATKALASLPVGIDTLSILSYTQSEERCYVLLAASKQERDEWVAALRAAVEYKNGKATSFDKNADKKKTALSLVTGSMASSMLAAAAAASSSSSSSSTPSPSSASSAAAPSRSIPTLSSSKPVLISPISTPVRTLPKPLTPSSANTPVKAVLSPAAAATASAPSPSSAASAATAAAVGDDDEWSDALMTGRNKGESVAYVNLAMRGGAAKVGVAAAGAASKEKPAAAGAAAAGGKALLQVSEEEDGEEDEEEEEAPAASKPTPAAGSPSSSAVVASIHSRGSSSASTPTLMLVEKSVQELYSTEATYVNGLRTICTSYLLRIRKSIELRLEPKWLEDSELASFTFFQHIETILSINEKLLKELREIQQQQQNQANVSNATEAASPSSTSSPSPSTPSHRSSSTSFVGSSSTLLSSLSQIGSCFRQFIPFFKVYTLFAQTYDEQLKSLEALSERRPHLKNFLMLTDACEGTTLASLMITPVQRVGRYVLLLETILRNSPSAPAGDSPAAAGDIELALSEMKKVGMLINETVALWEAKYKVVELQARIDVPILQPGRFLVREGVLKKLYDRMGQAKEKKGFFSTHLGKKQDSFVFCLFNDCLMQLKRSQIGERYSHRVTMPLDGMSVEDAPDTAEVKNSWTITYQTGQPGSGSSSSSAAAAAAASVTVATTPTATATARLSEAELLQASPLASIRPPSVALSSSPVVAAVPPSPASSGSAAADASGADDGRKTLVLQAANPQEKARWLSDIQTLIHQTMQNKKTLMVR